MRAFEYSRPDTLADAAALLDGDGAVRPLAGGTDLLPLLKTDIVHVQRLVDLKGVRDLPTGIEVDRDGLHIGALTRLTALENDRRIFESYRALSEAAGVAATPQLRNMATIGGNLVQRPRCWYYRNALFTCWLQGGTDCQARDGENQLHAIFDVSPCVAVHPSDPAVALLALDARVQTTRRTLPIADFFVLPRDEHRRETILASDELVVSITLPPNTAGWRSTYCKAMNRKVWAFALVSVAVALRVEDGRIAEGRIVLGGVAPTPWRVTPAETRLVGAVPSPALFTEVAATTVAGAQPLGHNAYKVQLVQGLVRQALSTCMQDTSASD